MVKPLRRKYQRVAAAAAAAGATAAADAVNCKSPPIGGARHNNTHPSTRPLERIQMAASGEKPNPLGVVLSYRV